MDGKIHPQIFRHYLVQKKIMNNNYCLCLYINTSQTQSIQLFEEWILFLFLFYIKYLYISNTVY